jgi:predicted DNA-binding protein
MAKKERPAASFNMRLTDEDRERLAFLMTRYGMPASMVVRQALRREVEALEGVAPKPRAAPKSKTAKR